MRWYPYLFYYRNGAFLNPDFLRVLTYKPVTAYTVTQPILVNGVNINGGLYPVLNYQPSNAQYPYVYVPIAEFSKVGAKVLWDESKMLLTVTTDYYNNKKIIEEQQTKIAELQKQVDLLTSLPSGFKLETTNIEGVTDAQLSEINTLIATKPLSELSYMQGEAYKSVDELAKSKGGEFTFGTGISGDFRGASMGFSKNGSHTNFFDVKIHTNDPNLEINYSRYTAEQLDKLSIYTAATFIVLFRASLEKIQSFS